MLAQYTRHLPFICRRRIVAPLRYADRDSQRIFIGRHEILSSLPPQYFMNYGITPSY